MAENNITATREGLIAEIQRRVDDKILEQTNADLLTKLIRNADTLDEAMAIAQLGTTYKRTGLHYDKRLEKQRGNTIKYFKKNEELSFSDGTDSPHHKLIIGDNYDALQNLLIQYRGKVDVIYIDPPYGKDSMGEFAQTNYDNAITRDNLLSMLQPRLELAKQLLCNTGVIFCSIDDKNQAYVKCLMDEVFGEKNFIENFCWIKTETPANLSKKSKKAIEYIICYEKNRTKIKYRGLLKTSASNNGLMNQTNSVHELVFPAGIVNTSLANGKYEKGVYGTKAYDIELLEDTEVTDKIFTKPVHLRGKFKWTQDNLEEEIKKGTIISIKTRAFSPSYDKLEYEPEAPWNIINKSFGVGTNESASAEVDSILGPDKFDFPKPISLIKYLASFVEANIIVDFFAGSGTTGHAILDMIKDGDEKQFILCQVNEVDNKNPHGVVYDSTAPRLKRIMTGSCYEQSEKHPFYTGCNDFPWLKDNEPYGGSLDVYEIESVSNAEHVCGKTPFDVIDETLYGKEKFDNLEDKIRWVCENFEVTQDKLVEKK